MTIYIVLLDMNQKPLVGEIAKRDGLYHKVSKNSNDCLVYLLTAEASVLNMKKFKKLIIQKDF